MRFVVFGSSMEPTYFSGDRLFVSRFIYRLRRPHVGDVVVVRDPRDGRLLLKRIAKVESGKCYFLRGDNGIESTDSRTFGPVPFSGIVGRALFRYYRARTNLP